ncbi:hypothetical protein ALI144C_37975 [Actinosynnema sp. ALI-1.44]|uniref:LuxR C-terminal-related transcriptional regulator n=1 Tax=Actinosynnema sp. ALI-1.44 TaxID=1933779 RepID=UPI00097CB90D|nr:response regulator transcription factor [Actinosynnema sp. ALI-1.44]ONI74629.1 hypothetical protein ALI144C_37975 [Actinosynnema sp. ALI-1.44]
MLRILLADRDPVMRTGLAVLVTQAGMTVAGQVNGSSELVHAALTCCPDVVVGEFDGLAAVEQVARAVPGAALLMFTTRDDDESVRAAVNAGVRGYLHKSASPTSVVRAIESVAAGEAVLGPRIAARLPALASVVVGEPDDGLTDRQQDILRLLGEGCGNAVIAARLGIAAKTVGNQIPLILAKLGVPDRAAAIDYARRKRPPTHLMAAC